MVDILVLQTVSIAVASASIVLAAIYYISSLRHNMKAREMEVCRLVSSDYTSEQGAQRYATMMNMEWKDFKDFMQKYRYSNPEMFGKWASQFSAWEMMGVLLKNKIVKAEEMHDLGGFCAITGWEKYKDIIQGLRNIAWGQDMWSDAEFFAQEMLKIKMKKDTSFKDKLEAYTRTFKP